MTTVSVQLTNNICVDDNAKLMNLAIFLSHPKLVVAFISKFVLKLHFSTDVLVVFIFLIFVIFLQYVRGFSK